MTLMSKGCDHRRTSTAFGTSSLAKQNAQAACHRTSSSIETYLSRQIPATVRLIRRPGFWDTVDTLAHPFGKGILAEPYRWAEVEQLTISPSRWERRLVGSTIATIPHVTHAAGRTAEVAAKALGILGTLIGDAEPDVQKSLAWAYRSMASIAPDATAAALEAEAETAASSRDGHRAWVIRDALAKLAPATAADIRYRLAGIRRRPGAPATSQAAGVAAQFEAMGLGGAMPEPPLT